MRDAAAKFLVQFPGLPAGVRLARNEAVIVEPKATTASAVAGIEAVPVEESEVGVAAPSPPTPSSIPPTSDPPPTGPQPLPRRPPGQDKPPPGSGNPPVSGKPQVSGGSPSS